MRALGEKKAHVALSGQGRKGTGCGWGIFGVISRAKASTGWEASGKRIFVAGDSFGRERKARVQRPGAWHCCLNGRLAVGWLHCWVDLVCAQR